MKRVLFFIFLIGFAINSYSQSEFSTKFKAIPPKFNPKPKKTTLPPKEVPEIVTPNVFKSPDIFSPKTQPNSSYSIGKTKEFSMVPSNEFANPGDVYMEKMAKDLDKTLHEGDQPLIRKNIDLGDYRTKSKYFIVKYRDYIYVDGDLIRVYSNDRVIESQLYLDGSFNEFKITLAEGFNKIEFEALSMGTSGGNTAEIQIFDDKNTLISKDYWNNLATGFKAKMVIVKE